MKQKRLLNFHTKGLTEAGCDEAGRGCLAGPVCAAAVILPVNFRHKLLNDSKLVEEHHRDELRHIIEEKALAWAVGFVSHTEIDKINILNASFLAMHRAIEKLAIVPQSLLIDGNRFNAYRDIRHHCIIKGDSKFKNIAAASILAKTHRDEHMLQLATEHPEYHWHTNKGYPTIAHRKAIRKHGLTSYHRRSFRQLPGQMGLFDSPPPHSNTAHIIHS